MVLGKFLVHWVTMSIKYIYFLIILFIYLGCAGSSLLHRLFCIRRELGLLSCGGGLASHCRA